MGVGHSELNGIEKAILLSESMATHKAKCAGYVLGIPVKSVQVNRHEPNRLIDTLGLVQKKQDVFMDGWMPSGAWMNGREVVGVADVNASSQVQGDTRYVDERKLSLESVSYKDRLNELSETVASRAKSFGGHDVVTRIENGIVFERRDVTSGKARRSVVVTRGYLTTPGNTLRDVEFLRDYMIWTGMGETHFKMPWGRDQVSWLAWILMNKKIGDYKPSELVKLPNAVKRYTASPKDADFELFERMGRFNPEWLEYVDPRLALALLQMGANFTEGAGVALLGSLSHQNSRHRVIYQQ